MIVLPYLGKRLLQIHTRISRVMKNKFSFYSFRIFFEIKCKLMNFLTFKDKILVSYVLALFINLSVLVGILRIMVKLSAILKSECVKILEYLLLLERKWKGITILPEKNIIYFAIIRVVLTIFPY